MVNDVTSRERPLRAEMAVVCMWAVDWPAHDHFSVSQSVTLLNQQDRQRWRLVKLLLILWTKCAKNGSKIDLL